MSFKQRVPDTSEDWDTYWNQTSIKRELSIVKTDGLNPIFEKYLKKEAINIEAGCGLGKWVIALKNKGYKIIGLDTYAKGLIKLKAHDKTLKLLTGDVLSLPLESNSIDSYISLGVVEHFEEGPQVPLREAYRSLKPGGIAFIEVPFDSPLRQINRNLFSLKVTLKSPVRIFLETLGLRQKRQQVSMRFYEYRYTQSELKKFVKQAGFKLIELLPKDDLASDKSISLWLDYPRLRHKNKKIFQLSQQGKIIKAILHLISPFSYPALIVAVCTKPSPKKSYLITS